MVFSSPPLGFICLLTGQTLDLFHPLHPDVLWCVDYFYLHLTHPYSIFVTPLSSNPPLSPIAPLLIPGTHPILRDSESSYSFYFYLPPMFIIGYGPCARPALIMYVYKRLVSAVGIPQT